MANLLNAFRASLNGTSSQKTPWVPAALGGYLLDSSGERRSLGEVRQLLLAQFRAAGLTSIERTVISLYYGLELTLLPESARTGQSCIASLLPPVPRRTGRPRAQDHGVLGAQGARYVRNTALTKLASTWQARPTSADVASWRVPNPLRSTWFTAATADHAPLRIRGLVLRALQSARRHSGLYLDARRELWHDLDWWEHQSAVAVLPGSVIGRPARRINTERLSRANARMEIALWELLRTPEPTRPPSHPAQGGLAVEILLPPAEVLATLMIHDELQAAQHAIHSLRRQVNDGLSSMSAAYLLAWLEPRVVADLDDDTCGEGAAVLTRAAADHHELNTVGLRWFRAAAHRKVNPRYLAEAALNLSVAAASRRKYAEAEWILIDSGAGASIDSKTAALLAIGHSAWRRRVLSESIAQQRFSVGLREIARASLQHAIAAVTLLSAARDAEFSVWLRAAIRQAEALALSSALVAAITTDRAALKGMRDLALRLFDDVSDLHQQVADRQSTTAYDLARVDVIRDVATTLDSGGQLTEFGILRRVQRIQEAR